MPVDMQTHRPTLILFIVIPAVFLLLILADPFKLQERDSRSVALRNLEEVDRIVLVDSYHTTELNKGDGSWYLFGSEPVSPIAVENLLIAASRLEVSSIVTFEESEASLDAQEGFKEITYFKGDKPSLSYGLKSVSGRYLLHPAASGKAYFVALPGYPDLDLDRVFSATPDHYREHLLIDLRPSDISSIEIELSSGEAFRFSQDQEAQIECKLLNDSISLPEGEANELAMKLLFSYFTSIRFERPAGIPADSLMVADSISTMMAHIGVTSFDGEHHSLQVFPYLDTRASKPDLFKALVLYNDEQEAMFVNYIYLDVLMRGLSHYFGEK